MGKGEALVLHLDDAGLDRSCELFAPDAGSEQEIDRRQERSGRKVERPAASRVERPQPLAESEGQRRRCSAGHPSELQREHGIACGRVPQLLETWARELPIQAPAEHRAELGRGQRANRQSLHVVPVRQSERQLVRQPRQGALGDQHPQRHGPEPAQREGERRHGRPIQPLDIVDGEQKVALSGFHPQELEHRPGKRRAVYGGTRALASQRGLDRSALRSSEDVEGIRAHGGEEIAETDVGQLTLAQRRPRTEDPHSGSLDPLQARPHNRGLADPRLAGHHERPLARAVREQLPQHGQLGLAADDIRHQLGCCLHLVRA